ncbi:MAG: hypothetical protein IT190_07455 [Microbacteriaceae bacterium]|nr:hypothetical protein [Microbacteriaceae bacterium]
MTTNTDKLMAYAQAGDAYQQAQENLATLRVEADDAIEKRELDVADAKKALEQAIIELGQDPMDFLKKKRKPAMVIPVGTTEKVQNYLGVDSFTIADLAAMPDLVEMGVSEDEIHTVLSRLIRVGKAKRDGRGVKAVYSAAEPGWSDPTPVKVDTLVPQSTVDAAEALAVTGVAQVTHYEGMEPERLEGVFRTGGTENHDEVPF